MQSFLAFKSSSLKTEVTDKSLQIREKKRTREIYAKYSYSSSCYFNNKALQHNVFEKQLELKPREKHFVVDDDETCLTAQELINSSLIPMTSIS